MDHQTTPPLLVDQTQLQANLEQIWAVAQRTHAHVLLDQTAFPAWPLYPMLGLYLSGTTADNAALAQCGLRHMDRDSHGFFHGFSEETFDAMLPFCHHITFGTLDGWQQCGPKAIAADLPCALRICPDEGCQDGIPLEALPDPLPREVIGLQIQLENPSSPDALTAALDTVERRYGSLLPQLQRFSLGGNFPLTDPEFQLDQLEAQLLRFRETYDLLMDLEVGNAVTRNAVAPLPNPPIFSFPFPEGYPPLYWKHGSQVHPFSHF